MFENQRRLSEWIVVRADAKPGATVLELAAGPGETGFLAAELLGLHGRLISTDLSDEMVSAARRGAAARGITNIEFRIIDAQAIDLPDGSVDAVISRFGLMLLPEPDRAVRGMRRVLRPGRPLAYGVSGPPQRNPWLTTFAQALVQNGHTPAGDPFGVGGPFSLAEPDANRRLLGAAGFDPVDVEEIGGTAHYDSLDDFWDLHVAVAGSAVPAARLSDDERTAVKTTLRELAAPFEHDGAYDIPWLTLGVCAS